MVRDDDGAFLAAGAAANHLWLRSIRTSARHGELLEGLANDPIDIRWGLSCSIIGEDNATGIVRDVQNELCGRGVLTPEIDSPSDKSVRP